MNAINNAFDMKCPACGESDRIDVAATVFVRLCQDGTDIFAAANGDHEWTDTSAAHCGSCGHPGTVASFTEP